MNRSRSFTARPFPTFFSLSMRNREPASAKILEKVGPRRRMDSAPLALELFKEPGPSIGPQQIGRARRDAQDLGRLLAGQAGEKAELDQFRGPGVRAGQLLQQLIQFKEAVGHFVPDKKCLVEVNANV